MRQIEYDFVAAVFDKEHFHRDNTEVLWIPEKELSIIYLHGTIIARMFHSEGRVEFSLAGYDTNITRSRLRAMGIPIYRDGGITKLKSVGTTTWDEMVIDPLGAYEYDLYSPGTVINKCDRYGDFSDGTFPTRNMSV